MREKLKLNGEWFLVKDPTGDGEAKQWYNAPPLNTSEVINLPLTQPLTLTSKNTTLWFFRRFDITNSWKEPQVNILLSLEYINFQANIWVNGHRLETHTGALTKFTRPLPSSILNEKDNLIVIEVKPLSDSSINSSKYFLATEWAKFPGIWGDIILEKMPPTYIESFYIKSDLRNKRIIINIYPNKKNLKTYRVIIPEMGVEIESNKPKISIPLQEFQMWTLENPKLYLINIQLDTDQYTDEITTHFGIRDLSITNGKFCFNFVPIILKTVYFDWLPHYLPLKDFSEENLKKHLKEIKEAGFNSILSIDKPLPEKLLQICDEIGIIVGESTSFIHTNELTEQDNSYFENELTELLISHRNHPSFGWLFINTFETEESLTKLVKDIRKFDRVRALTIVKNIQSSERKCYSVTPFTVDLIPTELISFKPWLPANNSTLQWLESLNISNSLHIILNYDFICAPQTQPLPNLFTSKLESGFEEKDLALSFQSPEKLLESAKLVYIANYNSILQSIRKNENIAGYCLFKFSLNELEIFNNLLSLFSINDTVKQTLKRYNQNLKILINLGKTNLLPSESTSIDVNITYPTSEFPITQTETTKFAEVLLQITSPTQQTLWKKKKLVKIKKDLYEIYSADISASSSTGTHILTGKFIVNKAVISETNKSFYVAPYPSKAECPIEIIDPDKYYTKPCLELVEKITPLAPIIILPPLSNTIFGYPDNELTMMLNSVKDGAIGIIFSPPKDWNSIKYQISDCPELQLQSIESYPNAIVFHYVKPHPIFMNLPTRQLMRLPYKNIISKSFFLNKSDEDPTGVILFPNSNLLDILWGTTILILRYGVGRLVFSTLRILENIESDPVAQHIFINLLNHMSRRAIAPEKPPLPIQNAVEFIRYKKNTAIRKWSVLGPLPKESEYENIIISLSDKSSKNKEVLTTIFGTISPKTWYTIENENHTLNFFEAFDIQIFTHHLEEIPLSGFAYGEFTIPQKCEAIIQIKTPNQVKIWLNGVLILENLSEQSEVKTYEVKVILKNIKNSILVKCSKEKGSLFFNLNLFDINRNKLNISWAN